jgi:hypothetical protein
MAYDFDGTNNCESLFTTPDTPTPNTYPLTVAIWARPTASSNDDICGLAQAGGNERAGLVSRSGSEGSLRAGAGTIVAATSGDALPINAWHSVVGVFETATDKRLYIDGVEVSDDITSRTWTAADVDSIYIGGRGGVSTGNDFVGQLAELAIYDGALSDPEVAALVNFSPDAVRPDILAYYFKLLDNLLGVRKGDGAVGTLTFTPRSGESLPSIATVAHPALIGPSSPKVFAPPPAAAAGFPIDITLESADPINDDFDDKTADVSGLAFVAGAELGMDGGSKGMEVTVDGATRYAGEINIDSDWDGDELLRIGNRFDPNSSVKTAGADDSFDFIRSNNAYLKCQYREFSGAQQLRIQWKDDPGGASVQSGAWVEIDDSDHSIELEMQRGAAGTGHVTLICDGVDIDTNTGLTISTTTKASSFEWGKASSDDYSATIPVYIDDLRANTTGDALFMSEFFVDSAGDDSNDGSSGSPWKTIAKVNSSTPANSTVRFKRAQTFTGQINTPSDNIIFTAVVEAGADPIIDATGNDYGIREGDANGCTVSELEVINATIDGIGIFRTASVGGNNWTVEDCETRDNGRHGVTMNGSTGGTIDNVNSHDNGNGISCPGCTDLLIRSCQANDNTNITDGDGINVANGTNVTIELCTATGNNNGTSADGYQISGTTGLVFRYNRGFGNLNGDLVLSSGCAGSVYYNVFGDGIGVVTNSTYGMHLRCAGGDLNVYNNTVGGDYDVGTGAGVFIAEIETARTLRFKNNCSSSGTNKALAIASSLAGTLDSDHNAVWVTGAVMVEWDGNNYSTAQMADYQAASSLDANSIGADPLFAAPGSNNFHPGGLSPILEIGVNVGLTLDFDQDTVPQGLFPDIGAFEEPAIREFTSSVTASGTVAADTNVDRELSLTEPLGSLSTALDALMYSCRPDDEYDEVVETGGTLSLTEAAGMRGVLGLQVNHDGATTDPVYAVKRSLDVEDSGWRQRIYFNTNTLVIPNLTPMVIAEGLDLRDASEPRRFQVEIQKQTLFWQVRMKVWGDGQALTGAYITLPTGVSVIECWANRGTSAEWGLEVDEGAASTISTTLNWNTLRSPIEFRYGLPRVAENTTAAEFYFDAIKLTNTPGIRIGFEPGQDQNLTATAASTASVSSAAGIDRDLSADFLPASSLMIASLIDVDRDFTSSVTLTSAIVATMVANLDFGAAVTASLAVTADLTADRGISVASVAAASGITAELIREAEFSAAAAASMLIASSFDLDAEKNFTATIPLTSTVGATWLVGTTIEFLSEIVGNSDVAAALARDVNATTADVVLTAASVIAALQADRGFATDVAAALSVATDIVRDATFFTPIVASGIIDTAFTVDDIFVPGDTERWIVPDATSDVWILP